MNFSIEENKKLCERFPFLLPRNGWDDKINDDYDYSYILGIGDIPEGWNNLFLQMCEDIRQPLIDANYIDKFRFSQIKEKYAELRCYNFGAPEEVQNIIDNYCHVSKYICECCGKPAKYKTTGWIVNLCQDCIDKSNTGYSDIDSYEHVKFNPIRKVTRFSDGVYTNIEYDCSDIWNRLYPN